MQHWRLPVNVSCALFLEELSILKDLLREKGKINQRKETSQDYTDKLLDRVQSKMASSFIHLNTVALSVNRCFYTCNPLAICTTFLSDKAQSDLELNLERAGGRARFPLLPAKKVKRRFLYFSCVGEAVLLCNPL